jgi:hypothetical protein
MSGGDARFLRERLFGPNVEGPNLRDRLLSGHVPDGPVPVPESEEVQQERIDRGMRKLLHELRDIPDIPDDDISDL